MMEPVQERLQSFGYVFQENDALILEPILEKVTNTVKNDCNVPAIPDGLMSIAVDMAAGEFLLAKATYSPGDIAGLDLSVVVKQIQTGDTNTTFAVGAGSLTPEQRLNNFINYLLSYGKAEFSAYRKIKW